MAAGAGEGELLWGLRWTRERSKEGKSILAAVLPDEGAYERFMQRFDADDSEEVGLFFCLKGVDLVVVWFVGCVYVCFDLVV